MQPTSVEEQVSASVIFTGGCHVSHDLPCPEDVCQDTMAACIAIPGLFVRKDEICINGKASPMLCRPAFFPGFGRYRVVYDRVQSCISNQSEVRVFIHYGYRVLSDIPAVAQNDDILLPGESRHYLSHYECRRLQFGFLFLPQTVSRWDSKASNFLPVPDRYTEHDAGKAVPVQIIEVVVGGMVKKF